jgi:hypothetical protein
MGRFIRAVVALLLALFARPGPVPGPASASMPPASLAEAPPEPPPEDEDWYEPRAEDFRPHYDRDIANGGKQTWEQYWGWVRSFYQGNLFAKGWNDRARWLVERVGSEGQRKRLRTRLNALGRDICAEWSKDYDVRKVGSADLITWGKMLEKARAVEDGSGAEIHRALDAIAERHRRKTQGGPSR